MQLYKDENVTVKDGKLIITAKKEKNIWFDRNFDFTSGMIFGKIDFEFGIFEASVKLPKGAGFWPAFWLLQAGGEIDILEVGGDNITQAHTTTHRYYPNRENTSKKSTVSDLSIGFHKIKLDRRPNVSIFYIDDIEIWRQYTWQTLTKPAQDVTSCEVPQAIYLKNRTLQITPSRIIINLALGGPFTSPPNENTTFPSNYEIEYVKVWAYDKIPIKLFDLCEIPIEGPNLLCDFATYEYKINNILKRNILKVETSDNLSFVEQTNNNIIKIKAKYLNQEKGWLKLIYAETPDCDINFSYFEIQLEPKIEIRTIQRVCGVGFEALTFPNSIKEGKWKFNYNNKTIEIYGNYASLHINSRNSIIIINYEFEIETECKTIIKKGSVSAVGCRGKIQVSPNPSTENICMDIISEVDSEDGLSYENSNMTYSNLSGEIFIYDNLNNLRVTKNFTEFSDINCILNVSQLELGQYYIFVNLNDDVNILSFFGEFQVSP